MPRRSRQARHGGLLTAPANPGGTGWQLKVFMKNQASAQLFIHGLAVGGASNTRDINIGAYPAAPSSSFAALAESARSDDPANETLQQVTYSITLNPGQQIHLGPRLVTGSAGADPVALGAPDDLGPVHRLRRRGREDRPEGDRFRLRRRHRRQRPGRLGPGSGPAPARYQDSLIEAVATANPDTIVVLNTGDPVLMPWVSSVKSILEMWFPG